MLPLIRRARAEAHAASASASPPSSSVRSVSVPARAEAHAASASVAVPAPTPLPPLALLPGVPRVRYAAAAVSAAYGAALLAWLRSASAPPWTTLRSRRVCAVSPPADRRFTAV